MFSKKKLQDAFGTPPHQRPINYNQTPIPSLPNPTKGKSQIQQGGAKPKTRIMQFPETVHAHTSYNHQWHNQITDYVLKLEERIHELECRLNNEPVKDALSENPWIASDTDND